MQDEPVNNGTWRAAGRPISRRRLLAGGATVLTATAAAALASCSGEVGNGASGSGTADSTGATGARGPSTTAVAPDGAAAIEAETPFLTPTDRFFRIDTASDAPEVSADDWSLRIHGMVDNPLTLTLADLARYPATERTITLSCVSNEVGGRLVGNAVWGGVLLSDVLRDARVQPGAEQLFSTSIDRWTCGFPVEAALDDRGALIATSMNGEPLTPTHGFPARLVVPGLYGYVSATKWVTDIELTTWEAEEGYWIPRGWSALGPIKPQSRIDVPRRTVGLDAGPVVLGGVAWAQRAGVAAVQVRIGEQPWVDVTLDSRGTGDTWRQWHHVWQAEPGEYRVSVRVVDTSGAVQTGDEQDVAPDGATGWHTRRFTIR